MNEFNHIRIIIGFIVSLSIAQLLRGLARLIVHPTHKKHYWVHLAWVAYMFLNVVFFWWWEYQLSTLQSWVFSKYLLVITYIVLLYLCCYLLFPDDIGEYKTYRDYYFSRLQWFFGTLALTLVMDIADTYLKGQAYIDRFGVGYSLRLGTQFILCVVAMWVKQEWYHIALVLLCLMYMLSWIIQHFFL